MHNFILCIYHFYALLYIGKFWGVKFWQIATDEANGKEYFGRSDARARYSVVVLH